MGKNIKLSIRLTVVSVFILVTLITASLAISLQYYFGQRMAREVAQEMYIQVSDSLVNELASIERQSVNAIELLAEHPALQPDQSKSAVRHLFARVLQQNPLFYGLYTGREDGSFYELINLEASPEARQALQASPSDRWVEIVIQGDAKARQRHYLYLDSQFQRRTERKESTHFDPRRRPWHQEALKSQSLHQSEPYLFTQLQAPGRTFSLALPGQKAVLGMDFLLSSVSTYLRKSGFGNGRGEAFIFNAKGQLLAGSSQDLGLPPVAAPEFSLTEQEQALVARLPALRVSNELDWPPLDYALSGQPRGYSIEVLKLIADMTGLQLQYVNGLTWPELVAEFQAEHLDILQSLILTQHNRDWGLVSEPYITLPLALAAKNAVSSLADLSGKRLAIAQGWSIGPVIAQGFPDVHLVEAKDSLDALKMVRSGAADAAMDNQIILQYLMKYHFIDELQLHTATDLKPEQQVNQLHLMLQAGQGELVALINRALSAIKASRSEALAQRWLRLSEILPNHHNSVPSAELLRLAETPSEQGSLQAIRYQGEAYYAYVRPFGDERGKLKFFGVLVPRAQVLTRFVEQLRTSLWVSGLLLALMLPLSWLFASLIIRPVRALAIENDKIRSDPHASVKRVASHILEIDELSGSIVQMVATIKQQEQKQRDLLDAFIQLIAGAIDQKSPYTGGHCARVPELALMLVQAAEKSSNAAFADFAVANKDEWREIRIAAWLHDCGKITTPEYIVDKSTKLETIYNRIHEIRMRFEVLWRDADIRYWQQYQHKPKQESRWRAEREQVQQQLRDDFAFIAQCNIGGEYLDEEKQLRLQALASVSWQRNFDNSLGLSHSEAKRYLGPEQALPVTETLLRDGPEHCIERGHQVHYPPEFGIKMDVPELLYNRGELYNLQISRGTLTCEDRFKINEHIINTIRMLEALPFPAELAKVPRMASSHHETLDGRGYPRRLDATALSVPERLLAVADVFEALTASDRPYKKGKSLKQTLDILARMVDDQHIDRDAFELLLTSGVYQEYAQSYLRSEQCGDVDITSYLQRAD